MLTVKENLILIGQEPFLALTWEPDFSQHAVFFFFLTAIWLPYGQLWDIIEEAATLARC